MHHSQTKSKVRLPSHRLHWLFSSTIPALLLEHFSEWEAIVCYGIGRIGTCSIAQQQLALLLSIAATARAREPLKAIQV